MPRRGIILSFLPLCFLLLSSAGCSTTPARRDSIPSYMADGIRYYSLQALCARDGITADYDVIGHTVTLSRGTHQVRGRVDDNLVLVDNRAAVLRRPIESRRGEVFISDQFKRQVIEEVLKKGASAGAAVCPLPKFRTIIIDPGHGGHDPGAIGRSGLREKDVNLDIARRLSSLLASRGIKVVMTRSSDKFIGLPARVQIANRAAADLFVSIHSNANHSRSVNGFEVYYVHPSVTDSRKILDSARNGDLRLQQTCFAGDSVSLKAILWDMLYASNRAESRNLGNAICLAAYNKLGVAKGGVKPARFQVLKGAQMPAVLIEVGYVSNPSEERKLREGSYRQEVASTIAQGILGYAREFAVAEVARR